MKKLWDAARDYWAAIAAIGSAIVTAYNIADQLVKFHLVTSNYVLASGLLAFLAFGSIAIIQFAANDRKHKHNLPNIILESSYVDERSVIIPGREYPEDVSHTGTPGMTSPYQRVLKDSDREEKYYFAHAVFVNSPLASKATGCISEIEFYDVHMKKIIDGTFYGRFGEEKEQPAKRRIDRMPKSQLYIDILANGDKYELNLAMKHKQDGFCFAFNDNSYSFIEYRRTDYKLSGDNIFICVHLRGEKLELPPFWFELLNEGKNGSMKIKKITAPKKRIAE